MVRVPGEGGTHVLRGNGDGTFQTSNVGYVTGYSTSVAVGDFHGSGLPDLAVAARTFGRVLVLANDGKPKREKPETRAEPITFPFAPNPLPLASTAIFTDSLPTERNEQTSVDRTDPPLHRASATVHVHLSKRPALSAADLVDLFLVEAPAGKYEALDPDPLGGGRA